MTPIGVRLGFAAAAFCASATFAHAEVDHQKMARATLEQYIRPGYAELAGSAGALDRSVRKLCRHPSTETLELAKHAFAATVAAWSAVEPIRFGPVAQDHRYERIFFWPDPKGLGTRQLRRILKNLDESVTGVETLARKSVALQGLPPLQYLLYDESPDVLIGSGPNASFRCRYAATIAAGLAAVTQEIVRGWAGGAPYTMSFLKPGPDDPYYRSPKEVTLELYKTFSSGIEWVRDRKIGKPLGPNADRARPKLAAFWRSGLSFVNMADNLKGVRDLFVRSGLAEIVASESPGVERSVLFDLDHAIEVLNGIQVPIQEAVRDEDLRAKLEALRVSLKSAAQTAGGMIARGAGLSFGFNALDGD